MKDERTAKAVNVVYVANVVNVVRTILLASTPLRPFLLFFASFASTLLLPALGRLFLHPSAFILAVNRVLCVNALIAGLEPALSCQGK
jgi:hypothetical protein